jgi:hypothetical protein
VRNDEPARPAPGPVQVKEQTPVQPPVLASNDGPRKNRSERRTQPKHALVAVDSASEGASVYSDSKRQAAIFPIDASLQSLKVSIDDGHGDVRTIFVPPITFGSQRVLPTGNQFAPKGVW